MLGLVCLSTNCTTGFVVEASMRSLSSVQLLKSLSVAMGIVLEPTHSCGVSDLFRDPLVSLLCPPVWGVRGELFVLVFVLFCFVLFFDRARGERLREPLR